MEYYVAVTNNSWYDYLKSINSTEVNFWQPKGFHSFKKMNEGMPFLFELRAPRNKVGGIGFYTNRIMLPLNIAWEIFREGNGCATFDEFQKLIIRLRGDPVDLNPEIGCIVLTDPVFFDENDWLELPPEFNLATQQGKTYDTRIQSHELYWRKIQMLIETNRPGNVGESKDSIIMEDLVTPNVYSALRNVRRRVAAFKTQIIDIYDKRCSVSGEKTLPVLEAAHIKSYSKSGPNARSNGILLRADIHKLFDSGYVTLTKEHKIEVSRKIKEEFKNGREYYKYHGQRLQYLPIKKEDWPHGDFIDWHNVNVYKG